MGFAGSDRAKPLLPAEGVLFDLQKLTALPLSSFGTAVESHRLLLLSMSPIGDS